MIDYNGERGVSLCFRINDRFRVCDYDDGEVGLSVPHALILLTFFPGEERWQTAYRWRLGSMFSTEVVHYTSSMYPPM